MTMYPSAQAIVIPNLVEEQPAIAQVNIQASLAWGNEIGGQVARAVFPAFWLVRQVVLDQTKGPQDVRMRVDVGELPNSQTDSLPAGNPLGRGREAGRELGFNHDRKPPGSRDVRIDVEAQYCGHLMPCVGDQGLLFTCRKVRVDKPQSEGAKLVVVKSGGFLRQRVHHLLHVRDAQRVGLVCWAELT